MDAGRGGSGGVLHHVRGHGAVSAIKVDFRYAYLWQFEGGKVSLT